MKTFGPTRAVAAQSVATALAAVRANGLRVSTSRRLVLEALFATDQPLSAQRIASGLDGRLPPLDLASVYRNLETLEQLGVVRHFHLGAGAGLYALARHDGCEYLLCKACRTLRAVEPETLDSARAALRDATGWDARFTHFPIVATCPSCA